MSSRTAGVEFPERAALGVPVGIRPLRDRVDAVEVVLVATLVAGKETSLRTGTRLARTIGRRVHRRRTSGATRTASTGKEGGR